MGFDFIVIAPILPSHCGFSFVFGCGISFLVSSSIFLSMTVQQLVVIPVLSQEGVSTDYGILNVYFKTTFLHFKKYLFWKQTIENKIQSNFFGQQ